MDGKVIVRRDWEEGVFTDSEMELWAKRKEVRLSYPYYTSHRMMVSTFNKCAGRCKSDVRHKRMASNMALGLQRVSKYTVLFWTYV